MPRRRLTIGGNGPCCAPRTLWLLWLAAPVVAARGRRKRLPLVSPRLHVAGTLLFILVPWGGFGLPGDLWPLRRAGQNRRHLMARFHAGRRAPHATLPVLMGTGASPLMAQLSVGTPRTLEAGDPQECQLLPHTAKIPLEISGGQWP